MKKFISLFLALVMLMVLTACDAPAGKADTSAAPATEGTAANAPAEAEAGLRVLRVGCMEAGGNFYPTTLDDETLIGNHLVYERIAQRQPDGSLMPWLCESMEWVDDETMVFQLRDDVYFSNGDKFTGEDLIFTYEQMLNSVQASNYAFIDYENCSVSEDGKTVTFKFAQQHAPFKTQLDVPLISNKSVVENNASDEPMWWDAPITTGPYAVEENVAGSHTTYVFRDDYWNKDFEPEWDKIIVNYYTDATAMFIAFESGELDIVCSVNANDAARLIAGDTMLGDKAAYELVGTNSTYCLNLNNYQPELQDIKVREAIAHAIDIEGLREVAFGVLCRPTDSQLTASNPYYTPVGYYEYDVEYAKQCMAESGYPDGFELNVVANNLPEVTAMWEVIQGGLSQIGITLNFQSYDQGTCLGMWMQEEGNDMFFMTSFGGNAANEPSMCVDQSKITTPFPSARVPDDEYQEHLMNALQTFDTDNLAAEYEWIQNYLHDNFQCIPLLEDMACYAYNTDVVSNCEFYNAALPNLLFSYAAE